MNIVKSIPNIITSMNLLCGTVGVVFTFLGRPDIAFLLMLAAAVFDFCDGLAARLLNAPSAIGKELDSLSDLVSFGVLPAMMLFSTMARVHGLRWFCFLPLLLAVFSGLRLAKFNVDERQHDSFIGLATPSSAMICGAIADTAYASPESVFAFLCGTVWFIPALAAVLCALMVSEIPMFSMKFSKDSSAPLLTRMKRTAFISIAAIIIVIIAVARIHWSVAVTGIFFVYIVMNLVFVLFPSTRN